MLVDLLSHYQYKTANAYVNSVSAIPLAYLEFIISIKN